MHGVFMKIVFSIVFALFLAACSSLEITTSSPVFLNDENQSITIFPLENYTDTPQAGMRASNLIEGVLLSQGYTISNAISVKTKKLRRETSYRR